MSDKHYLSIFAKFNSEKEREVWFVNNMRKHVSEPVHSYSNENEGIYRDSHAELLSALENMVDCSLSTLNLKEGKKTLRDEFAAKAIQGLLSSEVFMNELDRISGELGMDGEEEEVVQPRVVAGRSYVLADAMLQVRNTKEGQ